MNYHTGLFSIKVTGISSDTLLNFGEGEDGSLRHLTIDSILYYEFYVDSYYCSIVAVQVFRSPYRCQHNGFTLLLSSD
jgi:hypothetical protein